MENVNTLIENIKKCNLSDADKNILLEKLNKANPDIEGFLQAFFALVRISKEVLKLFDFDIGD